MLYFPQIFNVDSNSMIGTQNSLFQWYHCCYEYTESSQEAPLQENFCLNLTLCMHAMYPSWFLSKNLSLKPSHFNGFPST